MANPKDEDQYIFGRDIYESLRLNYGHFHHTAILGHLLHPDIPLNSSGTLRIADLGAGTGIWSVYAARELRNKVDVRIDCFDISDEQYPPAPWRTDDVNYYVQNGFKPFSKEFHGQYDIVHVRFWLTFVDDPDVPGLLANFATLLKPGGYLQWHEPIFGDAPVLKRIPEASSTLSDANSAFFRSKTVTKGWPAFLPDLFDKAGYDTIATSKYTVPDELRPIGRPYSVAGGLQNKNVSEEDKTRIVKAEEEFRNGVTVETTFQVAVGRLRSEQS